MTKNILLILSDDHAQWAAGCYGNKEIETPNIDKLAATGVQMMNAFTPTPVCSPSRANLFTGKISSQHGIHDFLSSEFPKSNDQHWLNNQKLLPEYLQDNGYQTALVGKWHLGQTDTPHPAFDYWHSLSDDWPWEHNDTFRFIDNGESKNIEGYKTEIIVEKSTQFLNSIDVEKPFFLFVGLTATHSPWGGHPDKYTAKYKNAKFADIPQNETYKFGEQSLESNNDTRKNQNEALRQYYASVTHQDDAIGQILDELESKGLRENTLIIYSSDHGLNCSHHGIWGKGNGTLPLNMLDESIRIPMILNHASMRENPSKKNEFVDHCDLFETILDFANIDSPKMENNLPGNSMLPWLKDADSSHKWRDAQFCEYGDVRMIRTSKYKLINRHLENKIQLFDLTNDPREEIDISNDASNAKIIDELNSQLSAYFEKYQDEINSGLNILSLPIHNDFEPWRS